MTTTVTSHLRLEPTPLSVRAIGDWLRSTIDEKIQSAPEVVLRAELAVHEACMNVIDHANPPANSSIDLDLVLTTDALTVRICDSGDEFDLGSVPAREPDAITERGYGVTIIRSLVTMLAYRRVGETNELEMRIDLGKSS